MKPIHKTAKSFGAALLTIISFYAHAGGGGGVGGNIVFDPTNYIKNTITAQQAIESEADLVNQYMTQLQQYKRQLLNSVGISPQALSSSVSQITSQIAQYQAYKNALHNLYGGVSHQRNYMKGIVSMYGASNLSWGAWYAREKTLAQNGNNEAVALFNQGRSVTRRVGADMRQRAQLQSQLPNLAGLNQTMGNTNQYLDLLAGQNDELLQIASLKEQNEGVKQSVIANQKTAELNAVKSQVQKIRTGDRAYIKALERQPTIHY